jgi:hypothetical protein
MAKSKKAESKILKRVHKTVAGLHRIGLVDSAVMREFDAMCLNEPFFPADLGKLSP